MPHCHICDTNEATWFQIASHSYFETWNRFHELWKIFLENFGKNYWYLFFTQYLWCFRVKCENAEHGCEAIVRLDNLVEHSAQCEFNPKRPIPCESCEMEIPKNQIKNHNCIRDLRKQGINRISSVLTWFDLFGPDLFWSNLICSDLNFSFGSSNTRRIFRKR